MAPKKLTDCPENLREAIDWLIQVRHGNGEGGNGLGKLAEALKKLIEEAIEKAEKSLNDRKEQLECPARYWQSGSYCKTKEQSIEEKRKDIKEAEQIFEKSKTESELLKLKSELKKNESEKERHCNEDHYLSEDARKKALSEILDRLNTFRKLKIELRKFIGNGISSGECENILNNLCDGLEKFLGYSSISKGYTGKGIVYSDLDRLCDGVMGFLKGVLESVKNENEVTTYDNYITNEANKLNKVIEKLTKNIGTGSKGLVVAVGAVKKWLDGYEGEMEKRTENVKRPINDLLTLFMRHKTNVEEGKQKSLDEQFSTCKLNAREYAKKVTQADGANSKLDLELRKTLETSMIIIDEIVGIFGEKFQSEDLYRQAMVVDTELVNQKGILDKAISDETEKIRGMLDREFVNFGTKLKELDETSIDHFGAVRESIKAGRDLLDKEFGWYTDSYRIRVINYFNEIKQAVNLLHTNLGNKKQELDKLVEEAQKYFREIQLGVGNKGVLQGSINQNWDLLKGRIAMYVGNIKGKEGDHDKPDYLGRILKNVASYAGDFKKEGKGHETNFEKIVEGWVGEILKSDPVRRWLEEYVKTNHTNLNPQYTTEDVPSTGIYNALNKKIATKTREILPAGVLSNAVVSFRSVIPNSTVKENIKAIQTGCIAFTKLLGDEIQSDDKNRELASKIVDAIHTVGDGGVLSSDSAASNTNLIRAIQFTLYELVGVANGVPAELERFAEKSSLQELLNRAIIDVDNIGKEFDDMNGEYGKNITGALETVTTAIKSLTPLLQQGNTGSLYTEVSGLQSIITDIDKLKEEKESDGSVEYYKHDTENKMTDLKNNLAGILTGIYVNLTNADDALTNGIQVVKSTLQSAHLTARIAVDDLRQKLSEAVRKGFDTLTGAVRKLFAEDRKADFESLNKRVMEQYSIIEMRIKIDVKNGVKGLLKKMTSSVSELINEGDLKYRSININALITRLMNYIMTQIYGDSSALSQLEDLKKAFSAPFTRLSYAENAHFDNKFATMISEFNRTLNDLTPKMFAGPTNSVLLDCLRRGFDALAVELEMAYINVYEGADSVDRWHDPTSDGALTLAGKNCAKCLLTVLSTLYFDFDNLRTELISNGWRGTKIHINTESGKFFNRSGYIVSDIDKQNGEIRNQIDCDGKFICDLLDATLKNADHLEHLRVCSTKPKDTNLFDAITCLFRHVKQYNEVCHFDVSRSSNPPCTVYDMLLWLAGLRYNVSYGKVTVSFRSLFKTSSDDLTSHHKKKLDAHPETITYEMLMFTLQKVCHHAYHMLTSILGHGHADGRYACEFNTNPDGLLYPTDMNSLLCILFDIVKRLHHQLYFLYHQCYYGADLGGWADCWYGQEIGRSAWNCNTLQGVEQSCDRNCKWHNDCGVKSPLQSFLEDGLQGFLPHPLKFEKGKFECSIKNHSGMPCKTPMGFVDITYMASHRYKGKRIADSLAAFCGAKNSFLTTLCSYLNCLLPNPPQTLGDMFGFYYNFIVGWNDNGIHALEKAIKNANFKLADTTLDITPIFKNSDHGMKPTSQKSTHLTGDLYALVKCQYSSTSTPAHPCGSYLRPLCESVSCTFSEKHVDRYLSWIVYLTETFYERLQLLYSECCDNCESLQPKCHVNKCLDKCKAKNAPMSPASNHDGSCYSIVQCNYMRPTFFRFGFAYRDVGSLNGNKGLRFKRNCIDLCMTLRIATSKDSALYNLVYGIIPEFLWEIRGKFFWTIVSLWLLSLLYLLHIMVIRLDLLHIKSHLHSPSSHRIAAQSLLAAARVGKLGKLAYLQP